jgi:hypothetical protein
MFRRRAQRDSAPRVIPSRLAPPRSTAAAPSPHRGGGLNPSASRGLALPHPERRRSGTPWPPKTARHGGIRFLSADDVRTLDPDQGWSSGSRSRFALDSPGRHRSHMLAHERETSAILLRHAATPRARCSRDWGQASTCRSACQRDLSESPEPVGTNGKRDCVTGEPAGACVAIGSEELPVAADGFDACPMAARCDSRPEVAAGRWARGAIPPRLTQDHSPAQNTAPVRMRSIAAPASAAETRWRSSGQEL